MKDLLIELEKLSKIQNDNHKIIKANLDDINKEIADVKVLLSDTKADIKVMKSTNNPMKMEVRNRII